MKTKIINLLMMAIIVVMVTSAPSYAEESAEPITLKMMVVNPSDKHAQVFPMKTYLPEEVKPEHILDKGEMQLGFDEEKKAYYVSEEIEIAPGDMEMRSIQIRDVWRLSDLELESFSGKAHALVNRLAGTKYEQQGTLLLRNVEVLLLQIYESQKNKSLTPEEHIATYRKNLSKKEDVEMDMLALRRYLSGTSEESGAELISQDAQIEAMMKELESKNEKGQIPTWMIARVIFVVLFLVGGLSLAFFFVWARQVAVPREPKVDMGRIMPFQKDGERLKNDEDGMDKLREFLLSEPDESEEPKKSA